MKKMFFFIMLMASCTLIGQTLNYSLCPQNLTGNFRSIFFTNSDTGFATTYNGKIISTVNGGQDWTLIDPGYNLPLYSINFANDTFGIAVGGSAGCSGTGCIIPGSGVLTTFDGGKSWSTKVLDNKELYSSFFFNSDTGFVAGLGVLYKTTNSGKVWTKIELGNFYNIKDIQFVDSNTGFFSSLSGKLLKTDDGGTIWKELNTTISTNINTFHFWDKKCGYAGGGGGQMVKTIDGGATWQVLEDSPIDIFAMHCLGPDFIVVAGRGKYSGGDFGYNYGELDYSVDGGRTWIINDTIKNNSMINSLCFPSPDVGYFAGDKIMKIVVDLNGVNVVENSLNSESLIFYNPSNDNIYLSPKISGSKILTITDMNGVELVRGTISNNSPFAFDKFKSGVYVYSLIINDKETKSGKIIKR